MPFNRTGVKENFDKAVYWYKKAAAKNDPKATYNLGLCFRQGKGVKQSDRWAKHYFEKAASLGHKKAAKELKVVV